jgi:hypothetical protein
VSALVRLVICGFQSGADIAGAKVARRFGIPTSGYIPRGFLTEEGPRPEYAELYGAREHPSPAYPPRTKSNVLWADGILWFGDPRSAGGKLTLGTCEKLAKPHHVIDNRTADPWLAHEWLVSALRGTEGVLMVAGNREAPGRPVEAWVAAWLGDFCRDCLGLEEVSP